MVHLPQPASQFKNLFWDFRVVVSGSALTHPSFALSLAGSRALHTTGLDLESTVAVYPWLYNRKENPTHDGTEMS